MKIKIINPNTTQKMTENIRAAALRYAHRDTEIYAVSPENGPASIESYYDEYLAIPGVLGEIIKGEKEDIDAYIIACFGDPGLFAAREITNKPVVGIAEAAILTSKIISPNFSIVSVLERSRYMSEQLVRTYGVESWCRSIRSTGLSVLDFEKNPKAGLEALVKAGSEAVQNDAAECILLGCAGFVTFLDEIRNALRVPVLDGVSPAVKMAESLVELGCFTSKICTWQRPENKIITGYPNFMLD